MLTNKIATQQLPSAKAKYFASELGGVLKLQARQSHFPLVRFLYLLSHFQFIVYFTDFGSLLPFHTFILARHFIIHSSSYDLCIFLAVFRLAPSGAVSLNDN